MAQEVENFQRKSFVADIGNWKRLNVRKEQFKRCLIVLLAIVFSTCEPKIQKSPV